MVDRFTFPSVVNESDLIIHYIQAISWSCYCSTNIQDQVVHHQHPPSIISLSATTMMTVTIPTSKTELSTVDITFPCINLHHHYNHCYYPDFQVQTFQHNYPL